MSQLVDTLNGLVWSPVLIYFCLCAGLFYSVLTRFVQIRLLGEMWSLLRQKSPNNKGITSFQALALSVSGRVGTGNIAGVAAAIGFGGPGAVFWMWIVALLGAATSYVESTLAQIYKEEANGEFRGGPAYYFEKCLDQRWYAWTFAIATIIACGLCLPGVQANSIANAVATVIGNGNSIDTSFGVINTTQLTIGSIVVIGVAFIIFGGVKRIAAFAQIVVPFMALAYLLVAAIIIGLNITQLPAILGMIIGDAFSPMAGFGAAIGWGVKRGIYSNEAGQGTGPHAAAAADVEHPAQQGLVQALSVFIDTLFICTATALMILMTGAYNVADGNGGFLIQNVAATLNANSPAYTQHAVNSLFPGVGAGFVAGALLFFCFTTMLAYYYIAETNLNYINKHLKQKWLSPVLKVGVLSSILYGSIKTADLTWALGDLGVGMMAWLNIAGIIAIFFVGKPAITALKDYERQRKAGVTRYEFKPSTLGIKNAKYWEGEE